MFTTIRLSNPRRLFSALAGLLAAGLLAAGLLAAAHVSAAGHVGGHVSAMNPVYAVAINTGEAAD